MQKMCFMRRKASSELEAPPRKIRKLQPRAELPVVEQPRNGSGARSLVRKLSESISQSRPVSATKSFIRKLSSTAAPIRAFARRLAEFPGPPDVQPIRQPRAPDLVSSRQFKKSSSPRSPPPTPPPELESASLDGQPGRFVWLTIPVESIDAYRPGGLHPVHLGDTLHNGQYKIIRKLGYGGFSTVWLAHDSTHSRMVAIKIVTSNGSDVEKELRMYQTIEETDLPEVEKRCIMSLLDHFEENGPNGTHQCLVFQPTGPHVGDILDRSEGGGDRDGIKSPAPLSYRARKALIKQVLLGLHGLHSCKIAHGDLNMSNILAVARTIPESAVKALTQKEKEPDISEPVTRRDGKVDRWAPRYLVQELPLYDLVDFKRPFEVKVSDYGASFSFDSPPAEVTTPPPLKAPEVFLNIKEMVGYKIDIWSFGCLMFHILAGFNLFCVMPWGMDTELQIEDQHMMELIQVLGQPPKEIFDRWRRRHRYFTPELLPIRTQIVTDPEDGQEPEEQYGVEENDGEEEDREELHRTLEQKLDRHRPADMCDEELAEVCQLLRHILQWDVEARPTTGELLEHDWFKAIGWSRIY